MTTATETVAHQRQCPHCGRWFGWMAIGPHCASHYPLWCICEHPTIATAYGWAYCGSCLRGFEPSTPPISQHTLNHTRQQHEDPT